MPDIICLGEALIDFIPLQSGVGLMDVDAFKKAPGGAPANVAAGVSKLGGKGAFVGKVGDDPFGHFLERTFTENGVDTSRMLFDSEYRTGLAFVSLTSQGVPEFSFYRNPSADIMLQADEVDEAFIRSAKGFHYGSITLISEPSRSATLAAIKCASDTGLMISYDPNLRKPLWPSLDQAKEQMLAAMVYPHVVKVSEEELEFLTDTPNLSEGCAQLMASYPNIKLLAVTLGAEGCMYRMSSGFEQRVLSYRVNAVDTVGAGDGFVAGLLTKVLELTSAPDEIANLNETDLQHTFLFANAVAALTTTKHGAILALPTFREVTTFIEHT